MIFYAFSLFKFAGFWNRAGIWILLGEIETNSTVYIINTSENMLLGHYESDRAELGNNFEYRDEKLWKIGTVDNDGYFNLTHIKTEKLLTATSSPSNTLKVDKSMYYKNYLILTANILL